MVVGYSEVCDHFNVWKIFCFQTMGVVPSVSEIKISDGNDATKILFYDTTGSDVYYGVLPKYVS